MNHAIIGAGAIGRALASQFSRANMPVHIAHKSAIELLATLAQEIGPDVRPAPVAEALQSDMVFLAIPFDAVAAVVARAAPWNARIVVDCTNAIDMPGFTPRPMGLRASSELIADLVPGARLVKAFNTLPAAVLAQPAVANEGRRVLFVSGDEHAAKIRVAELAATFGFAPLDLGTLAAGGRSQQFGAALMGQNLIRLT